MPRTPNVFITNNEAAVDPTATDDETEAYDIGSRWTNTATQKVFFAVNVATGSAVWKDVSTPGAGSHPVTVDTVDPAVTDDSSAGFAVGDHWINSVSQAIFQVVDVSVGAAVWVDVSASGAHPVTIDTVDPAVTDDSNSGFAVGDHWINTVTLQTFTVLDVSVGAAVWERIDNLKHNITTTDPTVSNDNTEGYEIGSLWTNTTAISTTFVALDVSTGAAVWKRITNIKYNTTSVVDPQATDDNTANYEVGSIWFNQATGLSYICIDATIGAAQWLSLQNTGAGAGVGKDTPLEIFYGNSLIDYGGFAGATAGEVQYSQVWLTVGTVFEGGSVFIDAGGSGSRNFKIGLYAQADPLDFTGLPVNQLRETTATSTGGANGTFVRPLWTVASGGDFTIAATGYHWIALIADSPSLKFATTPATFRADFLPVRRESGTGTTLPAVTSGLSNPVSALFWAAVVENPA